MRQKICGFNTDRSTFLLETSKAPPSAWRGCGPCFRLVLFFLRVSSYFCRVYPKHFLAVILPERMNQAQHLLLDFGGLAGNM